MPIYTKGLQVFKICNPFPFSEFSQNRTFSVFGKNSAFGKTD
jgi:hypothetical protein